MESYCSFKTNFKNLIIVKTIAYVWGQIKSRNMKLYFKILHCRVNYMTLCCNAFNYDFLTVSIWDSIVNLQLSFEELWETQFLTDMYKVIFGLENVRSTPIF